MNEEEKTILCKKIFSERFSTTFQQYHGIDWPKKRNILRYTRRISWFISVKSGKCIVFNLKCVKKIFLLKKKDSGHLIFPPHIIDLQHWDTPHQWSDFFKKTLYFPRVSKSRDSNVDEIKYGKLDKICERQEWRKKTENSMRYFTVIECTIIQITNVSGRESFSETHIGFSQ